MRDHLLRWQLDGYPAYHADRTNLLIHIVAVPSFVAATLVLACGVARLSGWMVVTGLLGMGVAFLVQGVGHGREATPSIPFAGPVDAVTRIFAEQFVTFPRFVVGGTWRRALAAARGPGPHPPR